jgi:hypothetical protein
MSIDSFVSVIAESEEVVLKRYKKGVPDIEKDSDI